MRPAACLPLALALALAACGCVPNRLDVSKDGRTLYFAIGEEGPFGRNSAMAIYAMDVETGAMSALTDAKGMRFWPVLCEPGDRVVCMGAYGGEGFVETIGRGGAPAAPLTGLLRESGYPWSIPGPLGAIAMMQRVESGRAVRWVLCHGRNQSVPLSVPETSNDLKVTVGVAQDRFAIAVQPPAAPAEEKPTPATAAEAPPPEAAPPTAGKEILVYVVDLVLGPPPQENAPPLLEEVRATKVAAWRTEADELGVDLAFSADGQRLVAATLFWTAKDSATRFYELDPAGKAEPKLLFEEALAYAPAWSPDSKAVLYLRPKRESNPQELVRRGIEPGSEPKGLAAVRGYRDGACTTWRWLSDGRLRIYNLSGAGLRIVEMKADGSDAKAKELPLERLLALKALADFSRAWHGVPNIAEEPPADEFTAPFEAVIAAVRKANPDVTKAVEEAAKKANRWEEVPPGAPAAAPPAEAPAPASAPAT
jgi:hypothetical protein